MSRPRPLSLIPLALALAACLPAPLPAQEVTAPPTVALAPTDTPTDNPFVAIPPIETQNAANAIIVLSYTPRPTVPYTPSIIPSATPGLPLPTLTLPPNFPESLTVTPEQFVTRHIISFGPTERTAWLGELISFRFYDVNHSSELTWRIESYTEGLVLASLGEEFTPREVVFYIRALGEQRVVFVSEEPACLPTRPPTNYHSTSTPEPPCTPAPQRSEVILNVLKRLDPGPTYTPLPPDPPLNVDALLRDHTFFELSVGQTIGFIKVKVYDNEQFFMEIDSTLFEKVSFPEPATYESAPVNTAFAIVLRAIAPGRVTLVKYIQLPCAHISCSRRYEYYLNIYGPNTPFPLTPWWVEEGMP